MEIQTRIMGPYATLDNRDSGQLHLYHACGNISTKKVTYIALPLEDSRSLWDQHNGTRIDVLDI